MNIQQILKQIHQKAIATLNAEGSTVCVFALNDNQVYASFDHHAINGIKPKKLGETKKGKFFTLYGKRYYLNDFAWK